MPFFNKTLSVLSSLLRTIFGFFVHLQVPCLCIGICMDGDDDDDDGFV